MHSTFRIQLQGELPCFSDGELLEGSYSDLREAVAVFNNTSGHRRLLCSYREKIQYPVEHIRTMELELLRV